LIAYLKYTEVCKSFSVRLENEDGPIPDDLKLIEWQEKITKSCKQLSKQSVIPIKPLFIDALKKTSASQIKKAGHSVLQECETVTLGNEHRKEPLDISPCC
jgi:hypothetical protein